MRVHFTRSGKMGSRLIRAVSGENVSHVALEMDSLGVVSHATPRGVDIDSIEHFSAEHEIVTSLEYCGPFDTRIWERKVLMTEGRGYDYAFLLLLGIKLIIQKSFGLVCGPVSRWARRNQYICTEFIQHVVGLEGGLELTPGQLGTRLLDTGHWRLVRKDTHNE